jgi:hypothetical protein
VASPAKVVLGCDLRQPPSSFADAGAASTFPCPAGPSTATIRVTHGIPRQIYQENVCIVQPRLVDIHSASGRDQETSMRMNTP